MLISHGPLAASYYFLGRYRIYRGGLDGEKRVVNHLDLTLSDDYYLINDLSFHNGGGDIDHIALGPNGVFAIETKNWSGTITCNGGCWKRQRGRHITGSPSKQARNNATKVKRIINSSQTLNPLNTWVEPIFVFTNYHAKLNLKNPTIPVLKLQQLPDYIIGKRNMVDYSSERVQKIGKEFLKQVDQKSN